MRRVTIVTANGLFKKGKETNTTKRQSQEELRIAEGICQDTARRGQVRAVSFYQSCAKKIHPALPIAEWSGRCCCEMCISDSGKQSFQLLGGWRVGKCARTNVRLVESSGAKGHLSSTQPEPE